MIRKAFNFYRSYYEVLDGLSDQDKLSFLMGLIERQFTGKEPVLKGLARSTYNGQKHSIDSQIQGWEHKMKTKLEPTPTEGGYEGGIEPPTEGGYEPPTQGQSKNGLYDTSTTTEGGYGGGIEPPSLQEEEEEKEQVYINLTSSLSSGEFEIFNLLKSKFMDEGLDEGESVELSKSLLNMNSLEYCKELLGI